MYKYINLYNQLTHPEQCNQFFFILIVRNRFKVDGSLSFSVNNFGFLINMDPYIFHFIPSWMCRVFTNHIDHIPICCSLISTTKHYKVQTLYIYIFSPKFLISHHIILYIFTTLFFSFFSGWMSKLVVTEYFSLLFSPK